MNKLFSKEGILLLVQIDHLNGEILGSVFEYLYEAGALNVQCIQTITKKNRPGNILLIDVPLGKIKEVECIIINELGSTGWHRISTDHMHVPVEIVTRKVKILIDSYNFLFELQGKKVKGEAGSIRPEHSNCIKLKEEIRKFCKIEVPLKLIYEKVQTLFNEEQTELIFNKKDIL
ncbi:Protein of unknown function DUF111 [Anaerosphaera aminiphila DSM 21120]|uniref:Uncharacterized protein n=1 Tax=Anaerosphaera aminiphila DSM 21120 TaxID=1120995 RepID=A0A1M5Q829_9FIRM|nr:nickel insertion protein [Anaerosphaera aminiphila]SHH09941.1 Protein of unknown function DUF111 [Anaerosphaera aminiphila DSM 21120]